MAKPTLDEEQLEKLQKEKGRRLDALRRERGLAAKALYSEMGWDKTQYSRKYRGLTPITEEDEIKLRRILNAPRGWPHINESEGLLVEALGRHSARILKHLPEILHLISK